MPKRKKKIEGFFKRVFYKNDQRKRNRRIFQKSNFINCLKKKNSVQKVISKEYFIKCPKEKENLRIFQKSIYKNAKGKRKLKI